MEDQDDDHEFPFILSLRFRHPTRSTQPISEALGMQPGRAWLAGEPRATPTGEPLGGNYRDSYCAFRLGRGEGADAMLDMLDSATRKLEQIAPLLREWREDNGSLSYYLSPNGLRSAGFSLPPALLARMGAVGVELGIEFIAAKWRVDP